MTLNPQVDGLLFKFYAYINIDSATLKLLVYSPAALSFFSCFMLLLSYEYYSLFKLGAKNGVIIIIDY